MTPKPPHPIETRFFDFASEAAPFALENGEQLTQVRVAYEQYGELNAAGDNAILVFHALTGSQHAAGYNPSVPEAGAYWTPDNHLGWWDDFIGPGKAFNTDEFCVICANLLGGCYGSTGPASRDPKTGEPYGGSFPLVSFSDMVDVNIHLLDHLGIKKLHALTGPSVGGLLCLNFATRYPERVDRVAALGTGPALTSLQRLHNLEQICAIELDPAFQEGNFYSGDRPTRGLALARMIAHKTYVSLETMEIRARGEVVQPEDGFRHYQLAHPIESYMLHHGTKFTDRFDANTYLRIMNAWQHYDLLRGTGASRLPELFERCRDQRYMIFSIDSDVSFYPGEQRALASLLKQAEVPHLHITVHSDKGHDSFLLEPELFTPHLVYTLEHPWTLTTHTRTDFGTA